ncbi:MAG: Gfo/Idh/MocA family protein [Byssovorax sp.]
MIGPPTPTVLLVGTSGYGERHLDNLLDWHERGLIKLASLVDVRFSDGTRRRVAESGADPRWASTIDEAFSGGLPDVAVVATPPQTHFEMAKTVLGQDVRLYLEKPPVPLLQQLDALAALQRTRSVEIGFQDTRLCVETFEAVLTSEAIGDVQRITAHGALQRPDAYYERNTWAGRWFAAGQPVLDGPLFNPLAHILHTALTCATRVDSRWSPKMVEAEFYSVRDITGDDVAALRVTSERGPRVVAVGTTAADAVREPSITVHGTRGTATIRHPDAHCVIDVDGVITLFPTVETRPPALFTAVTKPSTEADELLDVAAVRPFVTVVNASVQAAGEPTRIVDLQQQERRGGETFRSLSGVTSRIEAVVASGRLFSELDIDWGRPGGMLDLTGYTGLSHPELRTELFTGLLGIPDTFSPDDSRGRSQAGAS